MVDSPAPAAPTTAATTPPSAYRTGDGSAVPFGDALDAWTSAALAVLTARARTYGATVTYGDLVRSIFARSGVATRSLMHSWVGDVLARVADTCADPAGERPPLEALVVRGEDGAVFSGYADAVERSTGTRPRDVELHAAEARLACYRALARDLPPDGGQPLLAARASAQPRRRAAAAPKPAKPAPAPEPLPAVCPSCFTQLPRSGQCDTCD
ncbi:hypothetical protein WDZ16_09395 [Pseudokineococcus marinus]|uniref:Uncharacterized protein n=1 Tax=Pseudokineococcus marinus TaxID=351215 RepID=A0A849BEU4_9ACTN|nr:hypothetical protein [Pseudokineococcus marinus]NNH21570.1 hypothetical protein [Pseudokineococcus marinus]